MLIIWCLFPPVTCRPSVANMRTFLRKQLCKHSCPAIRLLLCLWTWYSIYLFVIMDTSHWAMRQVIRTPVLETRGVESERRCCLPGRECTTKMWYQLHDKLFIIQCTISIERQDITTDAALIWTNTFLYVAPASHLLRAAKPNRLASCWGLHKVSENSRKVLNKFPRAHVDILCCLTNCQEPKSIHYNIKRNKCKPE